MKKSILGVVVLSALVLGACGKTEKDAKVGPESSSIASSSTIESTSSKEDYTANTENLEKVAKILEDKFNSKDEMIKVTIQNDVSDDTSDKPHSVIEAVVVDDESRKNLEETQGALNSNSANDTQRTVIYGIQVNVEEAAKELESEYDTISFINPDSNGNNMVLALANKNENIIPLVQ